MRLLDGSLEYYSVTLLATASLEGALASAWGSSPSLLSQTSTSVGTAAGRGAGAGHGAARSPAGVADLAFLTLRGCDAKVSATVPRGGDGPDLPRGPVAVDSGMQPMPGALLTLCVPGTADRDAWLKSLRESCALTGDTAVPNRNGAAGAGPRASPPHRTPMVPHGAADSTAPRGSKFDRQWSTMSSDRSLGSGMARSTSSTSLDWELERGGGQVDTR